jgi:hypothetical protein
MYSSSFSYRRERRRIDLVERAERKRAQGRKRGTESRVRNRSVQQTAQRDQRNKIREELVEPEREAEGYTSKEKGKKFAVQIYILAFNFAK